MNDDSELARWTDGVLAMALEIAMRGHVLDGERDMILNLSARIAGARGLSVKPTAGARATWTE